MQKGKEFLRNLKRLKLKRVEREITNDYKEINRFLEGIGRGHSRRKWSVVLRMMLLKRSPPSSRPPCIMWAMEAWRVVR